MVEKIHQYFEALERLSTEELDRSIEKLVRAEKRNTARVIAHIAEMSRRNAALERGYKNLFDYCVRRLNLSEGSVALRIQVANVARRFPQILGALAENRLSLTVAGLLAPHLTDENVETLLTDCAGMSKRQAEEHLVALRPKPVFEPSIRKAPTRSAPAKPPPERPPAEAPVRHPEPPPATPKTPPILQPATPEQFNFRFAAGKEFKEKFERLAEVLGVENASKHMAEIFEQALDAALDKKDPKRKLERRERRKSRAERRTPEKPRPDEISRNDDEAPSRHVPSAVRERVHARAGYRCEFHGPDGTRCRSRTGLEIEHLRPFAVFRSHDERFLRLYCRAHNRLSAERVYGTAFMQSKIDASRRGRTSSSAPWDSS